MKFENSVIVNENLETVFSFLENMDNYPKWNYAVESIVKKEKSSNGETNQYTLHRNQGYLQEKEDIIVTEYKMDKKLSFDVKGAKFSYSLSYSLSEESRGSTIIKNSAVMYSDKIPNVILILLKGKVKGAVKDNLTVLKKMLESGKYSVNSNY